MSASEKKAKETSLSKPWEKVQTLTGQKREQERKIAGCANLSKKEKK